MTTLGNGYDSVQKKEKPLGIYGASLSTEVTQTNSFNFSSSIFRSSEDYKRKSSSELSLDLPVAESINLKAALDFSSELSRDQDSVIYVINVQGIRRIERARIDQEKFAIDAKFTAAKAELHDGPYDFFSKYGDAYISEVSYGKEIAVIIKFKKKSYEKLQRLGINVDANLAGVGNLNQAVEFLKELNNNQLECEIFTQTKGFAPEQLPPINTSNFADLADWLKRFEITFNTIPSEGFTVPVAYKVESYSSIIPAETVALMDNVAIKARYVFAIQRCKQAIEFYKKYFAWVNDDTNVNYIQELDDKLEGIKSTLNNKQNFNTEQAISAIEALKKLINDLNAINIAPKLIDSFKNSQLSRNIYDGNAGTKRQISPPFQIPLSPEQSSDYVTFEVKSDAPLKGDLSLCYSLDKRVGYNDGTHSLARHINVGMPTQTAVPPELDKKTDALLFAFHYDSQKGGFGEAFNCCGYRPEQFTVNTYMGCRKPATIRMD